MGIHSSHWQTTLKAFLRRSMCICLCPPEQLGLTALAKAANDTLLQCILTNGNHILCHLFPLNQTIIIICTRNIMTANCYWKILICSIAIISFVYFIKIVTSHFSSFSHNHTLHFKPELHINTVTYLFKFYFSINFTSISFGLMACV